MRATLVLVGFLPLGIGFLLNQFMITIWFYELPSEVFSFIGIAVLGLWFGMSLLFKRFLSFKETVLLLNAPATLALLLIIFQIFFLGHLAFEWIGVLPQFFFFPVIGLAPPLFLFGFRSSILMSYVFAFVCMLFVSFLGAKLGAILSKETI